MVIGKGEVKNVEMEEKEGIRIDKGIRVEENMRKYEKNVYEIGDCERYDNFNEGRNVRME